MRLTVISRNDFPEGIAHPSHADAVVERWKAENKKAQDQGSARYDWHIHTHAFEVEYLSEGVRRYVEISTGLAALEALGAMTPQVFTDTTVALQGLYDRFTDAEKAAVPD